ncbi:MAG TPA: F0F1 ATP synthase subunit gamma [Chromatiaceae bacterium]|jgi:F-type H+-transporting ATPase subunit gamma|nr:MAG: F0F1 ATP synthase subunit gamma [Thiohalocapsa sp. PB-PSB1]QQO56132.1 MAG: F0F1 ATP synthase subunit gamma [Thiohalocapsa sp. PB-PSB1]HBG95997.1 F0F1 ATP synthase subunit gamma [Chromatiaceae bacterium]HCS90894.1 F0F1 ATP synthase subunit gamma [Chromatiaceae bacterium]
MAGAKEIRTKIASIKSTQKITGAMEMVAASKMRRAQDRMNASRPYAEKMLQVIQHLAKASPEYRHSFLAEQRPIKYLGYIVVSSDRGLCGGLNSNLFRKLVQDVRQKRDQGIEPKFVTIGSKALGFFKRFGGQVEAQVTHLGDKPHIEDLIGTVKVMMSAFEKGEVDAVHIAYNEFINTMTQKPIIRQLVPLKTEDDAPVGPIWDYIYEPDARIVLDNLLLRYIESLVYQAVVENGACEQAARMVAMKSASDNAGNLIDELQLVYNKARQAAITQEISEIVSGAAAV